MVRNVVDNAFLNTLTMETALPRVPLEMTAGAHVNKIQFRNNTYQYNILKRKNPLKPIKHTRTATREQRARNGWDQAGSIL